MKSLFINLFTKVTPARNQPEDYFTEIFAFLLDSHLDIFQGFISDFEILEPADWENIQFQTQKSCRAISEGECGTRPDIYINLESEDNSALILIESKIDSPEHDGQLS